MLPCGKKHTVKSAKPPVEDSSPMIYVFDAGDMDSSSSQSTVIEERTVIRRSGQKKRSAEIVGEMGLKVQDILGKVGDDINKTLLAKKKRMEVYIKESFKGSDEKVEKVWKEQQDEMEKVNVEYSEKFAILFGAWQLELKKFDEVQQELANNFQQQKKVFQQCRMIQNQRLETIKAVEEKFLKNLKEMENSNGLLTGTKNELELEMAVLRRTVVTESQQKDMTNVQNTLHSMLS